MCQVKCGKVIVPDYRPANCLTAHHTDSTKNWTRKIPRSYQTIHTREDNDRNKNWTRKSYTSYQLFTLTPIDKT